MEDGHPCNGNMWHPNWKGSFAFLGCVVFFFCQFEGGYPLNATEIWVVLSTVFLFLQGLEVVL